MAASSRELEPAVFMGVFKRLPVELARGQGAYVYDTEGREYLDFVAGIAVNLLGHGHPRLTQAIAEQAARLIHVSNLYYSEPQVRLAQALIERAFPSRVFFGNSGAEANECAIKIARKWGKLNRGGAFEIITARDSFHGRTLATAAATGQPKYSAPFSPLPPGFVHVPFNDLEAIRAATNPSTVAVMLEPIQGEIGVIPADPGYLQAVRAHCDEHGLLLIFDEVQTGMARTGTWYGYQQYEVVPDVMTLAKGLGGGVPIGACLAAPRADVLEPGDHGSTFGGNPLACAAGLAVIAAVEEEDLLGNAREMGGLLAERLAEVPGVKLVRGRGLMRAAVLEHPEAAAVQLACLERGLIVNACAPDVIRLVPPLVIGEREVERAVATIREALAATGGG